LVIRTKV